MKQAYYIAIPAYNEAKKLPSFFPSLFRAVKYASKQYKLQNTYICANGCTDETEALLKKYQAQLPLLKIKILNSEKGMNRALGTIMDKIPSTITPIIKVDADVTLQQKSLTVLLTELSESPELQIVGGHPRAEDYKGHDFRRKIITNILDIRSRYPQSQVATHDVSDFHKIAFTKPQPTVPASFELRSRIYFHGRFFALRNKTLWNVPVERIGDDTYLTLDVYKRFGKGAIRIRYDALCFYNPSKSLIGHWKVYKRIFCDTYTLFKLPEFQTKKLADVITKEAVKLDWKYIGTLPFKIQLCFVCYSAVRHFNNFLFNLSPAYSDNLWSYKTK